MIGNGLTQCGINDMPKTKTQIRNDIRRMVERIVEQFDPDKVILFGSHARGNAGPDSDVDLLVVMPVQGSKREKRIEIGAALADFGIPLDIIVSTPKDMEIRKNIPGTIERPATLEGRVLYERSRERAAHHDA